MKIIAGLGNPGKRYAGTPHNVGFEVVDRLAGKASCRLKQSLRFSASVGQTTLEDEQVLLVKPLTYMNRSGEAIGALIRYYKASPDDLIVVVDDADLPLGRIRIRSQGGTGGHNGLSSVQAHVGSKAFARVRLGIGRDHRDGDLVGHVLNPFPKAVQPEVEKMLDSAVEAVCCILDRGVAEAMNRYNAAPTGSPDESGD